MHRIEHNVSTGETVTLDLTADEIAAALARMAAETAARAAKEIRANQIATPTLENSQDVECTVAELAELKVNRAIATDCRKPNEEAGEGTGMLVFCVNGKWSTSAGTPASA